MYFMRDEQKHDIKENLKGGVGPLDFRNIVPAEMLYGAGTVFSLVTFKPGESIGLHGHTENFEIYFIVEGKAKVTDNGEERILTAGDSEICANGDTHSIENIGDTDLKIVALILNNFERK